LVGCCADGTETASLFASLGTEVLPDEEEPEEAGGGADLGSERSSDRDDYASDAQQQDGQQQRQQPRKSAASTDGRPHTNGRLRRQGSTTPPGAGARVEAAAPDGDGEAAGSGGKGDAKILRELFEGQGVRGAIDHSKVEGGLASTGAGPVSG
jgi:hypothetical protein